MSFEQEYKVLAKRDNRISKIYRLRIVDPADREWILTEITKQPYVEFAEKIPVYELQLVPNDPDYNDAAKRWHLDEVNAATSWDITVGCPSVIIAIVDDAVLTSHEDLIANLYTNSGEIASNGIDDDGNGYIDDVNGYDVADLDNNANPPTSATSSYFTHGTHVAGIACASSNNNVGTSSIGFNTSFIPVKTKKDTNLHPSIIDNPMQGVEYAIAVGADIISMSWGSYAYSASNEIIFNYAYANNIVCIAAAGNDGISSVAYPARYLNVIAVGASSQNQEHAPFTNHAGDIDVYAPGIDIWSMTAGSNTSYGFSSGTSMACPLVSGAVGLLLCHNPSITPIEIQSCLMSTATIHNPPTFNNFLPVLNVEQLLNCTPPSLNDCSAGNCELISNGSFETPHNTSISNYGSQGSIAFNDVCAWRNYGSNSDVFPLETIGYDHFGRFCSGDMFFLPPFYEGIGSNVTGIVSGEKYLLQFDFAVGNASTVTFGQDSLVLSGDLDTLFIGFIGNSFSGGPNNVSADTIFLHAITNTTSAFTFPQEDSIFDPQYIWPPNYFQHYELEFTAPSDPNKKRLFFVAKEYDPNFIPCVFIDNISLMPVLDLSATASVDTIDSGGCTDLSAITNAPQVIWEPQVDFTNPFGLSETVCPLQSTTYIVSAMDTIYGCTTSDTVHIHVKSGANIKESPFLFKLYPNPTTNGVWLHSENLNHIVQLRLLDESGKLILKLDPTEFKGFIELPESAGVYFLEISTDDRRKSILTVVKQN